MWPAEGERAVPEKREDSHPHSREGSSLCRSRSLCTEYWAAMSPLRELSSGLTDNKRKNEETSHLTS